MIADRLEQIHNLAKSAALSYHAGEEDQYLGMATDVAALLALEVFEHVFAEAGIDHKFVTRIDMDDEMCSEIVNRSTAKRPMEG